MRLCRIIQTASALALNPFLANFARGTIYRGVLKRICVPALNCYSCPAAAGACPIGSAQVMLSALRGYAGGAFNAAGAWTAGYVVGFIALVGAIAGHMPCGWVCPFGLLQELLLVKRRRRLALPRWTRFVKYAVLAVFVVVLPLVWGYGSSPPFCKYVCPAGTLEAGAALVGYDRVTGNMLFGLGRLFAWKVGVTVAFLGGILFFSRFFCRTICPLGASWGLLNRTSLIGLEVDLGACTKCGFCRTVCPVDISIYEDSGSAECVRCFRCTKCPQGAVKVVVRGFGRARRPSARRKPSGV